MTTQTVSINLAEELYRQVQQRAKRRNRSVADELAVVVEDALSAGDAWVGIPGDIAAEVAQLRHLDDDHLWRAARMKMPAEKSERMQTLSRQLKAEGLTKAEEEEIRQLQHYAQRIMLVRAEAAVLLQERGFDIADLRQSP
jgi:hypothetical protein